MPWSFKNWRKRTRMEREHHTDGPAFRQTAQTQRARLCFNWSKLLSSATRRMLQAATGLTSRTLTWLENHIRQSRRGHARGRDHKVMSRQFDAALRTCYKHDRISKTEMKEARRRWREAMKNVRAEDERRKEVWGEEIFV